MNFQFLKGKKVIDSEAKIIGEVVDIIFNPYTWEVTDLILKIDKGLGKELGWRKILGSLNVSLKTSFVKAVGDVVSLTTNLNSLKGAMEKYPKD